MLGVQAVLPGGLNRCQDLLPSRLQRWFKEAAIINKPFAGIYYPGQRAMKLKDKTIYSIGLQ